MEVSGLLHTPAALPPDERAPCVHLKGDWMSPLVLLRIEFRHLVFLQSLYLLGCSDSAMLFCPNWMEISCETRGYIWNRGTETDVHIRCPCVFTPQENLYWSPLWQSFKGHFTLWWVDYFYLIHAFGFQNSVKLDVFSHENLKRNSKREADLYFPLAVTGRKKLFP
jgi:hypothetical protein